MDSGNTPRVLTTKLVTFSGQHLFVNCVSSLGSLKIEILDEHGEVLQPFTADKCDVVNIDSTKKQITWSETDNLSAIRETKVRFKFYTTNTNYTLFGLATPLRGKVVDIFLQAALSLRASLIVHQRTRFLLSVLTMSKTIY
ncbi:MAG: hypothetical protein CM1200mP3_04430 [Chloroflexota bacterium]|nr:MAG: hypothetical protein CM1200mP3_04430 [Chloroflexota bacterium]